MRRAIIDFTGTAADSNHRPADPQSKFFPSKAFQSASNCDFLVYRHLKLLCLGIATTTSLEYPSGAPHQTADLVSGVSRHPLRSSISGHHTGAFWLRVTRSRKYLAPLIMEKKSQQQCILEVLQPARRARHPQEYLRRKAAAWCRFFKRVL